MTKRVVLITGCSSGIGEATAARLAKGDWTVYATARRPETLEALAAAGCRTLALDVTSEDSMKTAVELVTSESGGVDALVNISSMGADSSSPAAAPITRRSMRSRRFGMH